VDFKNSLVDEYMTEHPTTVDESSTIQQIMQCMNLGGFRHVIVVDGENKLKTVASIKDILNFLYENLNSDEVGESTSGGFELPPLPSAQD